MDHRLSVGELLAIYRVRALEQRILCFSALVQHGGPSVLN